LRPALLAGAPRLAALPPGFAPALGLTGKVLTPFF
jgi:hypothetical protein